MPPNVWVGDGLGAALGVAPWPSLPGRAGGRGRRGVRAALQLQRCPQQLCICPPQAPLPPLPPSSPHPLSPPPPFVLQLVQKYSRDLKSFNSAFVAAYIKMGRMGARFRSYDTPYYG